MTSKLQYNISLFAKVSFNLIIELMNSLINLFVTQQKDVEKC